MPLTISWLNCYDNIVRATVVSLFPSAVTNDLTAANMKIGKAKVLQRMVNGTFSDPSFGWETCPSLRNEADVYEEYWHDEFEPDLVVREHDVAFTDVEALDFRDEDTLADQPGPVLVI